MNPLNGLYEGNYKRLMILPLALLIPILFLIFIMPTISMGIDLTGGNVIIIRSDKPIDSDQVKSIVSEEFGLTELSISTISSPAVYGVYVEYSKDPKVSLAEDFLLKADGSIENAEESMAHSNSALKALGKEEQQFTNAKIALATAQTALAEYKEEFSTKFESILTEKLSLGEKTEFQKREVSPTLGGASLYSILYIALAAAIILIIIIFISFRQIVPSLGIIQAMIFDVLASLAGMALLGIPLSLVTVTTLLMVVGYSVDSNIMLTSRVIKEKGGTPKSRANVSVKTGLTMTGTTMAALIAMIAISFFFQIELVFQIAVILFFGQLGDVITTWFMNTPILLWFAEKRRLN